MQITVPPNVKNITGANVCLPPQNVVRWFAREPVRQVRNDYRQWIPALDGSPPLSNLKWLFQQHSQQKVNNTPTHTHGQEGKPLPSKLWMLSRK